MKINKNELAKEIVEDLSNIKTLLIQGEKLLMFSDNFGFMKELDAAIHHFGDVAKVYPEYEEQEYDPKHPFDEVTRSDKLIHMTMRDFDEICELIDRIYLGSDDKDSAYNKADKILKNYY